MPTNPKPKPEQFDFSDKVLNALVNVGKAADAPAGEVTLCGSQGFVVAVGGQGVGHGRRAHMGSGGRMNGNVLDPLAAIVDDRLEPAQALYVLGSVLICI